MRLTPARRISLSHVFQFSVAPLGQHTQLHEDRSEHPFDSVPAKSGRLLSSPAPPATAQRPGQAGPREGHFSTSLHWHPPFVPEAHTTTATSPPLTKHSPELPVPFTCSLTGAHGVPPAPG